MWELRDTTFRVARAPAARRTRRVGSVTGTTTNYSDTGLNPSTSYSYRVQATDAAGNLSTFSNIATATTPADTTPPSTPTNLAATAVSATQINLTWTASTDNVGVDGYNVQRCQGTSCTTFAQIAQPTANLYDDTGLTASTSYSYRVQAFDGSGNLSGFSTVATATTPSNDTTPPTAPSNLTATATSTSQINLAWTASTDNVGVTGYNLQRCSGSGCTTFAALTSVSGTTTTYSNTGLTGSTSYSYRVQATDAAGNLSAFSNTATATTQTATATTITFVQGASATPQTPSATVSVTYTGAQTAGNLNVVVVGWNDSTTTVSSVTDTKGNVYTPAVGPTTISGVETQTIYYAKNIAAATAGANAVKVTYSAAAAYPDIRILEYSGADPNTPVDVVSASTGNSASSTSAAVTTTNANDLLFGANLVQSTTTAAGSGFTSRMITLSGRGYCRRPDGYGYGKLQRFSDGKSSEPMDYADGGRPSLRLVQRRRHNTADSALQFDGHGCIGKPDQSLLDRIDGQRGSDGILRTTMLRQRVYELYANRQPIRYDNNLQRHGACGIDDVQLSGASHRRGREPKHIFEYRHRDN